MTALNAAARYAIREAGFTPAEWIRIHGYEGTWTGDVCGCPDNRCANGFHHMRADDCGCLPTLLGQAVAWREATRDPNSVELIGDSYGLNRWVDVSTPHVLATVSTAGHWTGPIVNGVRREQPEETSIRIAPREGWLAVVGEDERYGEKQMVIRFVKAPVITAAEATPPNEGDDGGH